MVTKGCPMRKLLWLCLEIIPRYNKQSNLDKLDLMDPQRPTKVEKRKNCKCAVCREDTRGHRRAACWDPKSGGQSESRISFVRTGNLTGTHWGIFQGDSFKVKVKQLLWREHGVVQKRWAWESEHFRSWSPTLVAVAERSYARLITPWASASKFIKWG